MCYSIVRSARHPAPTEKVPRARKPSLGDNGGHMIDKHERLLDYLAQAEGWVTAAELADKLGVTTRSVRSYVPAVKSSAHPLEVIASSTVGYRLNRDLYAEFLKGAVTREAERPRDRHYHLVR